MNLFHWDLVANQSKRWHGYGRFFRLLVAQGEISVTATYARAGSVTSKILAGIGVDLRHPETGEGFISLDFQSEATQQIKVLVTDLPSTDNRLTGEISVQGALDVVPSGGTSRLLTKVTLPVSTAHELLPLDLSRQKAIINFKFPVWLGVDNTVSASNGFYLPAGSDWIDENKAALWVYTTTASNEVNIFQDLKI